jgi:hypothetical protein
MQGDERSRHCKLCQRNVYNLSALKREEAENLVRASEGRLCVRFFRRHDGTMLTADCPVGLRGVRARLVRGALGIAATVLALAGSMLGGRFTQASSSGGTGIEVLDYGPLSRFSDWVNPRPVVGAMALTAPPPPAVVPASAPNKGPDSAAETAY